MTHTETEEALAHLTRLTQELSDEVARQGTELAVLARRVELLMRRAAEAEDAGASGGVVIGDERPPHY